MSEELPYDAIAHIRTDGVRLIDILVDYGLTADVPSCPGWTLGDLGWHIGRVWEFWGTVVADRITDVEQVKQLDRNPARPADDVLIDWITAAHTALYSALIDSRTGRPVWTWAGEHDVAWVRRRMTQETAVHRWDAANTVGRPYTIPTAVAADGIDEFLTWHARLADGADPVGGSVHIDCTDTNVDVAEGTDDRSKVDGEWLITALAADGATFTRGRGAGDVSIRGTAADVLLWLWGRDAGALQFVGDESIAQRLREAIDR
ncbi:MAG: maleylpyruvate isomerase family mycothiol-dependent enzyme [Actinomycetota bacterium]